MPIYLLLFSLHPYVYLYTLYISLYKNIPIQIFKYIRISFLIHLSGIPSYNPLSPFISLSLLQELYGSNIKVAPKPIIPQNHSLTYTPQQTVIRYIGKFFVYLSPLLVPLWQEGWRNCAWHLRWRETGAPSPSIRPYQSPNPLIVYLQSYLINLIFNSSTLLRGRTDIIINTIL